jgi:CBS domain-containing protein
LAKDIAVPNRQVIAAHRPLREALEVLRRKDLDFLPVVVNVDTREFVGLIHYREVMAKIHRELLDKRGSSDDQQA